MNNLNFLHSICLILIIHLVSMIFLNSKITISYIKIYSLKQKHIKVIIFILIYYTKFIKSLNTLILFSNQISLHILSQNLKKKKKNVNYISNFKLPRIVSSVNLDSSNVFEQ